MALEWLTASRIILIASSICIFGSLLMIGSGLLLGLGTRQVETEVIRALIVSTDPESDEYKEWANNFYGDDQVPIYREYRFWNLTNPQEFLAGEKPTYVEVGPYVFRENQVRFDIEFSDDENEVAYRTYKQYFYDGDSEDLDPNSDIITTVNPVYTGLVKTVGSESQLLAAGAPILLGQYYDLFVGVYVGVVVDLAIPTPLNNYQQDLVSQINQTTQDSMEAQREFCLIWANATEIPAEFPFFPENMLVSQLDRSGILPTSCQSLFNPNVQYALTNPDPTYALAWFSLESSPIESNPAFALITELFAVTPEQLRQIIAWRQRVKGQFTAEILALYQVDNLAQIGVLQWAQGSVSLSLATLLPTIGLPATPEFALWAQENSLAVQNFTLAEAELLLTGPNNLIDLANFITFATLISTGDWVSIQATWNLNQPQALSLYQYATSSTTQLLLQVFAGDNGLGGSGLITSNTPNQLLWEWVDPLTLLLDPNSDSGHFFDNGTETNSRMYEPDTFYTGRGEIKDINKYILYQNQSQIEDIWTEAVEVNGTDGTQFGPSVGKKDLWVFVPELLRSAAIEYTQRETLHDIRLHRYEIADVTLQPDPVFYQEIAGLANISVLKAGAPIFLSKSGMLDVPEDTRDLVNQRQPDQDKDDTYLDVEPITGRTMRFHKRLQVNLLVDQSVSNFDVFFPTVYSGAYNPIVSADETSEITEDLAKQFVDRVYGTLAKIFTGFVVLITFGSLFVVCGVALGLWGAYKLRRTDYQPLE